MYIGIDLGTSNSAIAGFVEGEVRIFKSAEGADTLPSVIYIDKRGHKLFGQRAYNQSALSPENTALAFKRLMGTSTKLRFEAAGIEMSAEECSAEILRTLLGQAYTEAGNQDVVGTVVTIPAAFNQMQSEATNRAARATGIERVVLLQEPIAAAMAAMSRAKNKSGQYLIYDLGGGTFDLALVQGTGGAVSILAHEGINMMGGRDIDRLIVKSIIRPWLSEAFNLDADFHKEDRYRRLMLMANLAAEKAKIALSANDSEVIFASDDEIRVSDRDGNEIYLEVPLARKDLERLVSGYVDQTLELSQKLIHRSGFANDDIDRIVFIGGPSKTPLIRDRVPQELGIPADLQSDPMIAVALGAAIFAESREWEAGATTRKATRATVEKKGAIEAKYDFLARTSDDHVRLRARFAGDIDTQAYGIQVDSGKGWSSGLTAVSDTLSFDIPVDDPGENLFYVKVFDAGGRPVPEATTTLTVTRTHASAAGIPATHTISVKIREGPAGNERNVLEPIIEKGRLLPARGDAKFRAAMDVHAGDEAQLDLELYEQPLELVKDPELNLFVGFFRIGGSDLSPGMAIRKGDEVVCHWTMNDSGVLRVAIEIPSVGQTFETGDLYADTAGHQTFDGESGRKVAEDALREAQADLDALRESLGASGGNEMDGLSARLEACRERFDEALDGEERRGVTEGAREIRQGIAMVRSSPGNRLQILGQQVDEIVEAFDAACRVLSDRRSVGRFDDLVGQARRIINGRATGARALEDGERMLAEMSQIYYTEWFRQPTNVVEMFDLLAAQRDQASDVAKFDELMAAGESAQERNDSDELRGIVVQLFNVLPSYSGEDTGLVRFAGLMRA